MHLTKFCFCRMILGHFLIFFTLTETSLSAELPLKTNSAFLHPDLLLIQAGVEYTSLNAGQQLYSFPQMKTILSLKNQIELEAFWKFLFLVSEGKTTESGSGDLRLQTKIKFWESKGQTQALGLAWGVKLPNANDKKGLGTDQTDFWSCFIHTFKLSKFESRLNIGLNILDNPFQTRSQVDQFTLGIAIIYFSKPKFNLFLDFFIQEGFLSRFDQAWLTVGTKLKFNQQYLSGYLRRGLYSGDRGFKTELSDRFSVGVILGKDINF